MALTLDQFEQEAAKLSAEEFHSLLKRLHGMETKLPADPGIEAAWDSVIAKRAGDLRDGTVKGLDLDEVLKNLDDEFGLK